jgi:hypothetical protein
LWISSARLTPAEAFGLNIGAPNGALAFDFKPQPKRRGWGFSLRRYRFPPLPFDSRGRSPFMRLPQFAGRVLSVSKCLFPNTKRL